MARTPPSRVNRGKILEDLRLASRKGDRAALILAIDRMKVLALSPRYWEKYLALLANPLARLVDLLVIKQGERIARLKGWKVPKRSANERPGMRQKPGRTKRDRRVPRRRADVVAQPSLFDL